jgi:PLP dependent protein
MNSITENYLRIREGIVKACKKAQRKPEQIQIMAVCKGQPIEKILAVHECGLRLFGENRTQEGDEHFKAVESRKITDIKWHFIGKLQKNKINKVLASYDLIQSVDGVKALEHIHKRVDDPVEVFLEVNVGDEKTKTGFTIEGLKKALNYISHLSKVHVTGLMAIPPLVEDAESARPFFVQMRSLQEEINSLKYPTIMIRHLSMGMSSDFTVAIEEGATIIRIGTALFGRRNS